MTYKELVAGGVPPRVIRWYKATHKIRSPHHLFIYLFFHVNSRKEYDLLRNIGIKSTAKRFVELMDKRIASRGQSAADKKAAKKVREYILDKINNPRRAKATAQKKGVSR